MVHTRAESVPWREVLRPGRGLAYGWLTETAPDLSERLHGAGWGPHGMVPFGYGAPRFARATRRRGVASRRAALLTLAAFTVAASDAESKHNIQNPNI